MSWLYACTQAFIYPQMDCDVWATRSAKHEYTYGPSHDFQQREVGSGFSGTMYPFISLYPCCCRSSWKKWSFDTMYFIFFFFSSSCSATSFFCSPSFSAQRHHPLILCLHLHYLLLLLVLFSSTSPPNSFIFQRECNTHIMIHLPQISKH